MAEGSPNPHGVRSWGWFWVWLAFGALTGVIASVLGGAFGVFGWTIVALVIVVAAPINGRIEYKITGRELPRSKRPQR